VTMTPAQGLLALLLGLGAFLGLCWVLSKIADKFKRK